MRKFFLKILNRLEKNILDIRNFSEMKKKKESIYLIYVLKHCISGNFDSDAQH